MGNYFGQLISFQLIRSVSVKAVKGIPRRKKERKEEEREICEMNESEIEIDS